MTDQTAPPAAVWIDGDPLMEAIASAVWEQCRTDYPSSVVDDPRNIAAVAAAVARAHQAAELARAQAEAHQYRTALQGVARRAAVLPAPADRAACPDPIECGHEAALGQAREETRRLGLMVDEYGAGESALTDKLRRARARHRETCILARGEVKPTAFRCGLCEVLDAPAAPLRRLAVEAQQPSPPSEDCTCIPFTRQGGVQRYCQPGDTVDMISGWEIGGDCPHHRDTDEAQQPKEARRCAHTDVVYGRCILSAPHDDRECFHEQQPIRIDEETDEDGLCGSEYPGDDNFVGQLCGLPKEHFGEHRCDEEFTGTAYTALLRWGAAAQQPKEARS